MSFTKNIIQVLSLAGSLNMVRLISHADSSLDENMYTKSALVVQPPAQHVKLRRVVSSAAAAHQTCAAN